MVHLVLAILPWFEVDHAGLEDVLGLLDRVGEYLVQKQTRQEVFSLGGGLEIRREHRNELRHEHLNPQLRLFPASGVQPVGSPGSIVSFSDVAVEVAPLLLVRLVPPHVCNCPITALFRLGRASVELSHLHAVLLDCTRCPCLCLNALGQLKMINM